MRPRPFLSLVLALCPCVAACGEESRAGANVDLPPDSPERMQSVADFSLTERSGATITRADLAGHPWIASFIFTTCAGPCPRITTNVRDLQAQLGDTGVRLVSFTVDPQTDTPEVLRRYADSYGADPARWLFLTGDEQRIHDLIRSSFLLSVQRTPPSDAALGMQVSHSARLAVVDGEGRVAGYYDGDDPAGARAALARARALAGGKK